eukprot:TRINITY_DN1111_c0_g1_i13.p1 TRINITY_DN1111_c0_g1~~TRINITY_DN1111_c0_g1_i13.p1  ORF type:complete len:148 (-),score=21.86 TRINITY_DN1111_c0_g1_i13:187-630(-)
MLRIAEKALSESKIPPLSPVYFHLLQSCELPNELAESVDFTFAFDVFPHCDLHTLWQYLRQFEMVLKPGGRALVHTANLTTAQGWARFSSQTKFTEGGFYFICPEMVLFLISKTKSLRVIKSSSERDDPNNVYFQRDFLVLVEKYEV